jgi:carnosine N-methyltransferase
VTHLRRQSFYALPASQWNLLAGPPFNYLDTLIEVDKAIDANAHIAESIVKHAVLAFGLHRPPTPNSELPLDEGAPQASEDLEADGRSSREPWAGASNGADRDKARSTIRQLFRDWSAEGAAEREACYGPVLEQLESEFGSLSDQEKAEVHVLVPGAGLARLMVEIVKAGYRAEGNEISYHQLMASSFVLNGLAESQQLSLYPFALSFSNHVKRSHQLRRVMIPDKHPGVLLREASVGKPVHAFERMSMSAADFCVSYKEPQNASKYNDVATVFFIDTAPNLFAYIDAVKNALKPGGIWINNGPLTWHFENNPPGHNDEGNDNDNNDGDDAQSFATPSGSKRKDMADKGIAEPGSFELSWDEVRALVQHRGFEIEFWEWGSRTTGYVQDDQSMLRNEYRPAYWVARKL